MKMDKALIEQYLKSELREMLEILHGISLISTSSIPIQPPVPYSYSYDSTNLVHKLEHAPQKLSLEKDVYGEEYRFTCPESESPLIVKYDPSTKTISY